jgi:hypothetical protein
MERKARKEQIMLGSRKFTLILSNLVVIAFIAVTALATGSLVNDEQKTSKKSQILEPLNVAILIQDDLVSHVSNELDVTRDFIRSLPPGSRVMVGYITSGALQVRQPFTSDLERGAKALRIPVSNTSASPFNPYVEVLEALRKFDSQAKNDNILLLISDGLDTSRGFDAATVLHSIDLDRAIAEAKRRRVRIYSFYAPSVGLTRRSTLAASYGQSSLNRVSNETGGKAFFQGTTDFVTFDAYFKRLIKSLNEEPSAAN